LARGGAQEMGVCVSVQSTVAFREKLLALAELQPFIAT
jgi:hypothetical protein